MNTPLSLRGLCSCLLVAASALAALAGRIVPTSMRLLADDMTGQLSHVRDAQGRECALVKVKIPYEGAEFGGVIKTEARPGFYNVWIEDGNKMMEIYFPNCDPVRVHFGDLMTPAGVVAPRTYELDIDADAIEFVANPAAPRDLGQDFAIFTLSPKPTGAALLIINGTNVSFDAQGRAMMLLPYGSHNFQIMADGFANYSGQVTVNKGGATNLTVALKSTQGTLSVNCATSGSTITVQDDRKSSSGSWSGKLPAGSYKVDISKQGYHSVTQIAAVEAGQECNLNIPALTPITGSLAVQVTPIGSTVKVDGKEAGTTPVVLRDLLIGTHNIEVTAPGYDPYTTTLTIAEGPDNPALTATLTETPADYSKLPLADLRRRAEAGDPKAQFQLGYKYYGGDGVTKDYTEAVKWYRKAAEQGYAVAQSNLGVMYARGLGVTQDYTEAVKWYRKAAEQGLAGAQNNLGFMYDEGRGITQDYTEALKWYRKAAEQGFTGAQNNLGFMYENGRGITQDYTEALKWYRKAAEQGNAGAQHNLGFMYDKGRGITQDYTEAVKWYRKAAEQGVAEAQCNLGIMYSEGRGVTQDYPEAVKWYRKAAEQGIARAQHNLGVMYDKGRGITQDYTEAVKWYRKAAEQGFAEAQCNLGIMYSEGRGVTQDYPEAVKWYRKAAEQGIAQAQHNLGFMYDKGQGITQDYSEAVKWYRKAAEQGIAGAQNNLGVMYENGWCVAKDINEAVKWYRKAAAHGDSNAQRNLRRLGY